MTGTGDPTQIREDIEAAREQLGETVEALAAKTDVTGQAKRKLDETRTQVATTAEQKPALLVLGALGATAVLILLRRRRRRDR